MKRSLIVTIVLALALVGSSASAKLVAGGGPLTYKHVWRSMGKQKCAFGYIMDDGGMFRCMTYDERSLIAAAERETAGDTNGRLWMAVIGLSGTLLLTLLTLFGFLLTQAVRNGHYGPFREDKA